MADKKLYVTVYENLAGVDFSQEAANVDNRHSPYSLNMISDNGKNPVKRNGWQTRLQLEGEVYNIWLTKLDGTEYMFVHAGTHIYRIDREDGEYTATIVRYSVAEKKGCGFFFRENEKDSFYILTGDEYLKYNGERFVPVADDCYVPTTIIARLPEGGGESYEDINLLSGKRCEKFTGDSTLVYQLSSENIDSVDKVEVLTEDGDIKILEKDVDYGVNLIMGNITFVEAQETPVKGQDNVYITYTKNIEGYTDKITKCTVFCIYGVGGYNRVFLTGNPDCVAYDFWSDVFRPSYWPDLNYAVIGAANTAVQGYLKIGKEVAVIKESSGQDTAIFMRSGTLDDSGKALFRVEPGIAGVGAVGKNTFALLNDDPLFINERGVYAICPAYINYDRVVRNRSKYIDPQLRDEKNLADAVTCVWNGCYLVAVNGRVYVLDGRKRISGKAENDYQYECYLWDNVPAVCLATDTKGELYFGTADGRICSFKTEADGIKRFSDDGEAIRAVWSTPVSDDGVVQYFKTLCRRGCLVVLAPYTRSSCRVYYATDGRKEEFVQEGNVDLCPMFEEIDFARMTFESGTGPREVYFNRRNRRYKRLQLVFENNQVDEGFGIFKIVKTYEINSYSKNRR